MILHQAFIHLSWCVYYELINNKYIFLANAVIQLIIISITILIMMYFQKAIVYIIGLISITLPVGMILWNIMLYYKKSTVNKNKGYRNTVFIQLFITHILLYFV